MSINYKKYSILLLLIVMSVILVSCSNDITHIKKQCISYNVSDVCDYEYCVFKISEQYNKETRNIAYIEYNQCLLLSGKE